MEFSQYSSKFIAAATKKGLSKSEISKCLSYAENLKSKNVPIIYNLTHLSRLTGFERKYLSQAAVVSQHTDNYYRYYMIPKKNGETREIKEPLPNLKEIQYWILNNILENLTPSSFAKAYTKNRGLKQNVRFHKDRDMVMSLDISDFFPSIKIDSVIKIFYNLGYSQELSKILGKLCCLKGSLPQGAPTSPFLSNLVFYRLDQKIANYCLPKDIRYTRYADDMTFSGNFDESKLVDFITNLLNKEEFKINDSKTRVMKRNERQWVTGVVVNSKIQLDRSQRRKIRQEMYFIDKFGLKSHMEHVGMNQKNYLEKLLGKINFGLYLNSVDTELQGYKEKVLQLIREY